MVSVIRVSSKVSKLVFRLCRGRTSGQMQCTPGIIHPSLSLVVSIRARRLSWSDFGPGRVIERSCTHCSGAESRWSAEDVARASIVVDEVGDGGD